MLVRTKHFGEIEIEQESVLTFSSGLPAFDHLRQFTLIPLEASSPFCMLQSLEEESVSFLVANPLLFYPDYDFQLVQSAQEELGIDAVEDVSLYAIVTIGESLQHSTLNLLAPIVLNHRLRLGKQIILHDTKYRTKHALQVQSQAHATQSSGTNGG